MQETSARDAMDWELANQLTWHRPSETQPTDDALAVQAATDPQAFGVLYDRTFDRVYSYVRYRVADRATADDLTAQTFTKVLENLHRYDPDRAPFGAWLIAIARNAVADHHRQRKRRPLLSLDVVRSQPSDAVSPESAAVADERTTALLAAVAQLTDAERDLIALKYGAGLSNRAIAAETGLRENTVAVKLHRALKRLRALLDE